MGKQKSFIIVGSTFLGFIVIIILFSFIIRNIKDTRCMFSKDVYTYELGLSTALAPDIYSGGVVESFSFEYVVEDENIIEVQEGTYSSGPSSVYCWEFVETGIQTSYFAYNEEDVISVKDGMWHVNGKSTGLRAEKEYSEEEIKTHAFRSAEQKSINCFIFNGVQTDIQYDTEAVVTRNTETGFWAINGKDTEYTYKGIQITVYAKGLGQSKLTLKGKINDEDIELSTTIRVVLPNPSKVTVPYLDNTIVVRPNEPFSIDSVVEASDKSVNEPLQVVEHKVTLGSDKLAFEEKDGKIIYTAPEAGKYQIKVSVPKTSFDTELSKYESTYINVVVIVVDATDEEMELIEAARKALQKAIDTIAEAKKKEEKEKVFDNVAECDQVVADAEEALKLIRDDLRKAISNEESFDSAKKDLKRLKDKYND